MIRARQEQLPADPHEAAAWWLARRRLGLAVSRDEDAFDRWLAEPANAAAWDATEGPIAALSEVAAHPQVIAMRETALAARGHLARSVRRWTGWGAIAAGLAAGMLWLAAPIGTVSAPSAPIEATAAPIRYATRIGERRDIRLPDGSQVALNTGSVVEVVYTAGRRDLRLLGGQALFRVARDPNRPFVVAAGDRRITATGTAFDVRLSEQGVVTVLMVEGHVTVEPARREGLARLIPAVARESLEAGEGLSAPPAGEVRIAMADVERATSWTRGRVIFRDDLLPAAVDEMNRYSSVRLVVADPRVATLRVSGVFSAESNENFIAALTAFYPVEATRQSPRVITLRWRDGRE